MGLTVVDLRHCESGPRNWIRPFVETLQPVSHSRLRPTVIPNDVQHWKEVSVPAEQDPLSLGSRPRLLPSAPNSLHTLHRKDMFCFSSPPCFLPSLRQIWEEEEAQRGERECDDAVDDEKPSHEPRR
jgi:hypothetical protein